jgi:hypothetical protein
VASAEFAIIFSARQKFFLINRPLYYVSVLNKALDEHIK